MAHQRRKVRIAGAFSDVPAWVLGRAATYAGAAKSEVLGECVVKYGDVFIDIIPPTPAWLVEVEPAYSGIPPTTGYTSSGFLFNPVLFDPSRDMAVQQANRVPDLDIWFLSAFAASGIAPATMLAACFDAYCSRLYYAEHGSNPPAAYFTYADPNLSSVMINRQHALSLARIDSALIPTGLLDGDTSAEYAGLTASRLAAAAGIIAARASAHAMNLAAVAAYGSPTVTYEDYFGGENPLVMNPVYYYATTTVDSRGVTVSNGVQGAAVFLLHSYQQGEISRDWYSVRVTATDRGFTFSDNGVRYPGVVYETQSGAFGQTLFARYNDYSVTVNGAVALPAKVTISSRIGWASSSQFKRGYYRSWEPATPPYLSVVAEDMLYEPIFNPLSLDPGVAIFTPPVLTDYDSTTGAMFNFSTGAVAYFTFLNTYQLGIERTVYQQIKFGVIPVEDETASLAAQKEVILGLITVQFNTGISEDWVAFGAVPGKLTTVVRTKSMYDV